MHIFLVHLKTFSCKWSIYLELYGLHEIFEWDS